MDSELEAAWAEGAAAPAAAQHSAATKTSASERRDVIARMWLTGLPNWFGGTTQSRYRRPPCDEIVIFGGFGMSYTAPLVSPDRSQR